MTTMMKRMRLTYALLLAAALPLLTACSNDDALSGEDPIRNDGKVSVHLRISQAAPAVTRGDWQDDNAEDDEMMNIWTVIAVHDGGTDADKVAAIYTKRPSSSKEIDYLVELPIGTYRFYSFANISAESLNKLLFSNYTEEVVPDAEDAETNTIVSKENFEEDIRLAEATVSNASVKINGNGFNPLAEDNGFGAEGIPMSNVQTLTITEEGENIDLVVIRLLAKIQLQVYNDSGSDITIEAITLTDLTANPKDAGTAAADNLMLLPNLNSKGVSSAPDSDGKVQNGHYTMEPIHGGIQPNLKGTPAQSFLHLAENDLLKACNAENTLLAAEGHKYEGGAENDKAVLFTFYVNESENPQNGFGHFFLKFQISRKNAEDGTETVTEERYTLITNNAATPSDANEKWDYIARNDYRIIPIVLDDYKLDLIPYDFPAIGVYPASVKEEDGIYTINFHDYGHFHLQPQVTKFSTSEIVDFTNKTPETAPTETVWGLIEDDFEQSWKSWTDYAASLTSPDAGDYENERATNPFYRTGYNVNATNLPVDGDDVGGEPVWYPNSERDGFPQWAPDWTKNGAVTYRPFIFGYIKTPGDQMNEDNKVYHEFSVYLYKAGVDPSAPRLMTYRLYMILDESQMMYPKSSRRHGVSAVRHTHGY